MGGAIYAQSVSLNSNFYIDKSVFKDNLGTFGGAISADFYSMNIFNT